jgi:hypothetical protein
LRPAGEIPHTARPATLTSPVYGSRNPAKIRSSVVLPQPLGPSCDMSSREDEGGAVQDPGQAERQHYLQEHPNGSGSRHLGRTLQVAVDRRDRPGRDEHEDRQHDLREADDDPRSDQPPPCGPGGMLVQRRSWDQRERGRRSWSGLRSRPRGGSRYDDFGRWWTVAEGGVRPDRVVVAAPAFDHDLDFPK